MQAHGLLIATKVSIRAEKPMFKQCLGKLPLHLLTLDFQGEDLQPNCSSRLKATDTRSWLFIMRQSSQQISCLCHFLPAFKKAWGFPGDSVATTEPSQCNYWGLCTLEPMLNKRSHQNEKPRHCSKEQPLLTIARQKPSQQWRPRQAKTVIKSFFLKENLLILWTAAVETGSSVYSINVYTVFLRHFLRQIMCICRLSF